MDTKTVEQARDGDAAAQERLVRALSPRLIALARSLGSSPHEAEEIAGDALYRGMTRILQLHDIRAADAWFTRILVNLWRDRLRRRREDLRLDDVDEPVAAAASDPELAASTSETHERVRAAIESLPTGQRAVVALSVYEGLSVAEIASALETTGDRVKANLWHGRRRLRSLLRDLLGDAAVGTEGRAARDEP